MVVGRDFEFLNALGWSRHHTRRSAARGSRSDETSGLRVSVGRARHVVTVVAAVELVGVLVADSSGHLAGWRYGWLKNKERVRVSAEVGNQLELLTGYRLSYRRIGRL